MGKGVRELVESGLVGAVETVGAPVVVGGYVGNGVGGGVATGD